MQLKTITSKPACGKRKAFTVAVSSAIFSMTTALSAAATSDFSQDSAALSGYVQSVGQSAFGGSHAVVGYRKVIAQDGDAVFLFSVINDGTRPLGTVQARVKASDSASAGQFTVMTSNGALSAGHSETVVVRQRGGDRPHATVTLSLPDGTVIDKQNIAGAAAPFVGGGLGCASASQGLLGDSGGPKNAQDYNAVVYYGDSSNLDTATNQDLITSVTLSQDEDAADDLYTPECTDGTNCSTEVSPESTQTGGQLTIVTPQESNADGTNSSWISNHYPIKAPGSNVGGRNLAAVSTVIWQPPCPSNDNKYYNAGKIPAATYFAFAGTYVIATDKDYKFHLPLIVAKTQISTSSSGHYNVFWFAIPQGSNATYGSNVKCQTETIEQKDDGSSYVPCTIQENNRELSFTLKAYDYVIGSSSTLSDHHDNRVEIINAKLIS